MTSSFRGQYGNYVPKTPDPDSGDYSESHEVNLCPRTRTRCCQEKPDTICQPHATVSDCSESYSSDLPIICPAWTRHPAEDSFSIAGIAPREGKWRNERSDRRR